MKFILYLSKNFFTLLIINLIFLILSSANASVENSLKEISSKLRCMTCQNQSIHESDTEFSKDIKKLREKKIKEGKTEQDIINYLRL